MQSLSSSQMSQQEQQLNKLAEWWQSYSQAIAAYTNQNPQPGPQSGAQAPNVNVASSPNSNAAAAAAAVAAAQYYGSGSGASSSMLGSSGNSPSTAPPSSSLQYADFYAQMEKYYSACASYTQGQAGASYSSGSYSQQSSGGGGGTHYSSGPLSQQQNTGYSASNWRGRSNERGRSWGRGQRGGFGRGWRQYSDHWPPSTQGPTQAQDTLKANPEDVFDWWVGPGTTSEPTIGTVGGHFSSRDDRGSHSRQHDVHRDDHRPHDVRKDDHHSDRYRNVREGDRSRWSPHGGKSPRARWDDDRVIRGGSNTNKTRSSLPEHPSHTPPKRIPESINFRNINAHMPTNVESLVQQQIQLMMSPLLAKTAPTLPPRQFTVPPTIRDKQIEHPHTDLSHTVSGKDHLQVDSRGVKGDQKRDSTEAGLKATTERSSRSRSRSPVRSKFEGEEEKEENVEGEKKIKKDQQDQQEADSEQKGAAEPEDNMDTANAKLNRPPNLAEDGGCQSPDSSNKEQSVDAGLEGYDSSKKYGEEYIREVTAFQCFLCGRRFWQQDEVEHHCRSQGHFTNYQKCKLNIDEDDDEDDK